ncbi:uncharacterized protein LOC132204207 [Neocloeon triangulifer]|uniref:uncharacterized protein LOC132204207 n=1 Tax=Neocloeon triangulifer TaxID=2078957 RepID=UPI00286EF497|nr:uncharacterized protein LOC132204207 [Neocloeon triangulifer]
MRLIWLLIIWAPSVWTKRHSNRAAQPTDLNQTALINTTVPYKITDENFISITLDPFYIRDLPWADPLTLKLAKELSPAWFKVAPTNDSVDYTEFGLTIFQWAAISHFATESGFDQIWDAGIFERAVAGWDKTLKGGMFPLSVAPPTKHDFPPPAGRMGFSASAADLRKVDRIKSILSRYDTDEIQVFGPEVSFFNSYREIEKFSKWTQQNADKVDAITWQPSNLAGGANLRTSAIVSKEPGDLFKLELLVLDGALEKLADKSKPIYISDSRLHWEEEAANLKFRNTFGATLLWADRLGQAAATGVSAVFQPDLLPLHDRGVRVQPHPDFWFAVLYKRLVGNRVLAIRSDAFFSPSSSFYAQCTPSDVKSGYDTGAVTIIGINLGPSEMRGDVSDWSTGRKEIELHQYMLTGKIDDKKMYLNGKELKVNYEDELMPQLLPEVMKSPDELVLPPYSIAFWVIPDIEAPACISKAKRRTKRSLVDPDTTHLAIVFPVQDIIEAEKALAEDPEYKEKRCFKNGPLAGKMRIDGHDEVECPVGCTPKKPGGCRLGGVKLVNPSCSTNDVLQKLVHITKQRRKGCCCDGGDTCEIPEDQKLPSEGGSRANNETGRPIVEKANATAKLGDRIEQGEDKRLDELIKTIFTSPQPTESTTEMFKRLLNQSAETNLSSSVTPQAKAAETTVSLTPVKSSSSPREDEGAPIIQESITQPLTQTTTKSTRKPIYDPVHHTWAKNYFTLWPRKTTSTTTTTTTTTTTPAPITTTTSSPAPKMTTLAPSPTTLAVEITTTDMKKRVDEKSERPSIAKAAAPSGPLLPPPYGQKQPYRFEGQIMGLVHPAEYEQQQQTGFRIQHDSPSDFIFPELSSSPLHRPLNDVEATKNRHDQYWNHFQTQPTNPQLQVRMNNPPPEIFHPSEQALPPPPPLQTPPCAHCSNGCEKAKSMFPFLEGMLKYLATEGASVPEDELNRGQRVLEDMQEEVNSKAEEVAFSVRRAEAQVSPCVEQLNKKIKTALNVLQWLKETAKKR